MAEHSFHIKRNGSFDWLLGAKERFISFLSRPGAITTIGLVAVASTVAAGSIIRPDIPAWVPGGGGFNGTCLVSNYTEWNLAGTNCNAGTEIVVVNQIWSCTQAATSYGPTPIRVRSVWTASGGSGGAGAANFDNGCSGDGNDDTIDFIVSIENVNGVVGGIGNQGDAGKTRQNPGPQNIQVTGNFDCGAPQEGAHPDTWQFQHQGDRNITIVNGTSGDWDAGTSTCQGAGGIIYTTGGGTHFLGGEYVLCNHAMDGSSTNPAENNTSTNAKFRAGRVESVATGGDPNCQGFFGTGGCTNTANLASFEGNVCENWNSATNTWVTDPDP